MTPTPLAILLPASWADLRDPSIQWQLGVIVACILGGWAIMRAIQQRVIARATSLKMVGGLGIESVIRMLWPLMALALAFAARPLLAMWHPVALLNVAIPLIGSFALIRLVFYALRRAFARSGNVGSFLLLFEKMFALVVWAGVALYITGLWPDLVRYLDQTEIPLGRHRASLMTVLQATASVGVTLIVALWAGALLEERLMQFNTMHTSLRVIIARMGRASLILIAVLASLSLVGIDLTILSVFGGALGVGLGLGLQKIVSSYVSGVVILLERSLAIGDMVMVDKYYGRVTRINARYTIVRSLDGIESVIPNEMLVASPVQNYSLSDSKLRLSTRITVGYQTDIDSLLPSLAELVGNIDRVLADPAPQALLMAFGADGMELEMGFWIEDPENGRSNLISQVNLAILHHLQERQVVIPCQQRELRIVDTRVPDKGRMPGKEVVKAAC